MNQSTHCMEIQHTHSILLFGGFRDPPHGSREADWNTQMLKARESVKWMFGQVVNQF